MTTIAQVTTEWQALLTEKANALAEAVGFIQRENKLNGGKFAQTLVTTWLSDPASTLADMAHAYAHSQQEVVTRQGLAARFTPQAAHFMECLVREGLRTLLWRGIQSQSDPWFEDFPSVWVYDSTVIQLPDELAGLWQGTTGSSLKIHVGMDLRYGGVEDISLHPGRCHDQTLLADPLVLAAGSLLLVDLGYFKLSRFAAMHQRQVFWLSRYKGGTQLTDAQGNPLDLLALLAQADQLDLAVRAGAREQLPCRLLACRVNDEVYAQRCASLRDWERRHQTTASPARHALCRWVIYLTNLPPERLTLPQVRLVYSLRWQIELLFKLWKSHAQLNRWRSRNPWRILCEIYAKLLALLFSHAALILAGCHDLSVSHLQAHRIIAKHAWPLAAALPSTLAFQAAFTHLLFCLQASGKIATSRSSPPTFQMMRALF